VPTRSAVRYDEGAAMRVTEAMLDEIAADLGARLTSMSIAVDDAGLRHGLDNVVRRVRARREITEREQRMERRRRGDVA